LEKVKAAPEVAATKPKLISTFSCRISRRLCSFEIASVDCRQSFVQLRKKFAPLPLSLSLSLLFSQFTLVGNESNQPNRPTKSRFPLFLQKNHFLKRASQRRISIRFD
jgi:hypothetical protein